MKLGNNSYIFVFAVLLVLIGVLYYFNLPSDEPEVVVENEGGGDEIADIEADIRDALGEGDYEIEVIPVEDPQIEMPDLSRAIPDSANERTKEKIPELVAMIEKDPDVYAPWIDLASYRKVAGDFDGAEEVLIYMTKKWPNYYVTYISLGDLYRLNKKNNALSEENYRKAIEKNDSYLLVYISLHQLYGYSYEEKKDLAVDALLEGLERFPNNIKLLVVLGEYYDKRLGDKEKAREYYEKVIEEAKKTGDTDTVEWYEELIAEL